MKITPKQFVEVLQKTSLSREEQRGVIDLLENLSPKQIEELYGILLRDSHRTQRIIAKLEIENQKNLSALEKEVKKAEEKVKKAQKKQRKTK
jgi:hypothetical protein